MKPTKPLLFFDGECNLCNGTVDFLMGRDSEEILLFASLQGETAQQLLPKKYIEDKSSLVLLDQDRIYTQSSAIGRLIPLLGGSLWLLLPYKLLPKFLGDWLYSQVAKRRFQLFGRRETCRVPTPEERERFLP